jgi:hypothetical protein
MTARFNALAPRIMIDLMREIPQWGPEDAASAVGNGGHESAGFTKMQEMKPVVPGSRGGYGWFQWTGPRRREFEAFCKANRLSVDSYEGNFRFLVHELKGPEGRTINKVRNAIGLRNKTVAFELAYERAGVKHYDSRVRYAERALKLYRADGKIINPKPLGKSRTMTGVSTTATGAVLTEAAKPISDALTTAVDTIAPAAEVSPFVGYVVMALKFIGILLVIGGLLRVAYARWDDAGRPLPSWWPWRNEQEIDDATVGEDMDFSKIRDKP